MVLLPPRKKVERNRAALGKQQLSSGSRRPHDFFTVQLLSSCSSHGEICEIAQAVGAMPPIFAKTERGQQQANKIDSASRR
mmetsp:Transcript_8125/g.14674  ORF Transcript_8125/g.14674 Transcript_8125/m.14674 type:complete len:81 (-) Transcript_8125:186-428(-)